MIAFDFIIIVGIFTWNCLFPLVTDPARTRSVTSTRAIKRSFPPVSHLRSPPKRSKASDRLRPPAPALLLAPSSARPGGRTGGLRGEKRKKKRRRKGGERRKRGGKREKERRASGSDTVYAVVWALQGSGMQNTMLQLSVHGKQSIFFVYFRSH